MRWLTTGMSGERPGTRFDLQWPAKIYVALWKGNLNTLFVERSIDGAVQVAGHVTTPLDIADNDAQLEVE